MSALSSLPFSRRAAALVASAAIATAGLVVLTGPAAPASAAPFECTSSLYWVQDGQLWEGNPLDDPFGQAVAPTNAAGSYNAVGFNEQDGLLWGIGTGGTISQQLVSIDDTGVATPHGVPVGLPAGTWYSGDVDDAGNLWVASQGQHAIYKINISTNTVTAVVNPVNAGAAVYAQDFVWYDGKIVRIHGTGRVRIIDPATGTFTQSGVIGSAAANAVAMWLDADDRLFIVANNTGVISEIVGWRGATTSVVTVATTTVRTLNGDGASCSSARAPFGIIATDDDYSSTPIRAVEGGTVGNIWGNDRLNLVVPPAGSITTEILDDGGLPGLTIGVDGSVTVPADSTPGTYRVTYEICSVSTPVQCDQAVITVVLEADPLVPSFTFVKSADQTAIRTVGQVVTYSFAITNTGDVTLTDPEITEVSFSGAGELGAIECPAESVEPDASLVCSATYTTVAADLASTNLTNTATATLTDATDEPLTSDASTVVIPVTPPVVETPGGDMPTKTDASGTGNLAATGADPAGLLTVAAVLTLLGGAVLAITRLARRRATDAA
ncbi:DUF6923 family protein [Microbacterium sp. NPDC087665]|uniref:DUF7507 domain-containing protein n=1 Tax=Microbacterium sp. NPDC087665 TaxID=3364194 RepID=UPI003810718F